MAKQGSPPEVSRIRLLIGWGLNAIGVNALLSGNHAARDELPSSFKNQLCLWEYATTSCRSRVFLEGAHGCKQHDILNLTIHVAKVQNYPRVEMPR